MTDRRIARTVHSQTSGTLRATLGTRRWPRATATSRRSNRRRSSPGRVTFGRYPGSAYAVGPPAALRAPLTARTASEPATELSPPAHPPAAGRPAAGRRSPSRHRTRRLLTRLETPGRCKAVYAGGVSRKQNLGGPRATVAQLHPSVRRRFVAAPSRLGLRFGFVRGYVLRATSTE